MKDPRMDKQVSRMIGQLKKESSLDEIRLEGVEIAFSELKSVIDLFMISIWTMEGKEARIKAISKTMADNLQLWSVVVPSGFGLAYNFIAEHNARIRELGVDLGLLEQFSVTTERFRYIIEKNDGIYLVRSMGVKDVKLRTE